MDRRRMLIEIAAAAGMVLVFLAVWGLQRRSDAGERERLSSAHQEAQREAAAACEARARRLATEQGIAVFQAFAAGIQGSAMANQRAVLEQAKDALLRLPHVAFVHVLAPDGSILTSSNQKFVVDGRADARASWALASSELQTRRSDLPGTVEIAAPFQGASGRAAVLWLAYNTDQVIQASAGG